MKFTRHTTKQLSPNLKIVYKWRDMRELGYLGADDQYPICCTYLNDKLIATIYWPDSVTEETIMNALPYLSEYQLMSNCLPCLAEVE